MGNAMSALPPDQIRSMQQALQSTGRTARSPEAFAERWLEMHAQAETLAQFADLSSKPATEDIASLPAALAKASEWQQDLAWQAAEDIDAMMQPGMTALRTITARGQDASAPAMALWREFHAARSAIIDIVTPQLTGETVDAA